MNIINRVKQKNIKCSSIILKSISAWLILNIINTFKFGMNYDL